MINKVVVFCLGLVFIGCETSQRRFETIYLPKSSSNPDNYGLIITDTYTGDFTFVYYQDWSINNEGLVASQKYYLDQDSSSALKVVKLPKKKIVKTDE